MKRNEKVRKGKRKREKSGNRHIEVDKCKGGKYRL
jgi:hypothetical protein